ncbi:MAG: hypothetical protein RMZ41_014010 [Nostoc sp. DedVER02]|uniref:hypothetical protein n=1 Tax=unclassified Nostoc TaxID=2593658 RepID=UPI002AD4101F|nr:MULTISPECIES: hypothetical protein [unclassified Nostoc]MDZ7987361.1 hypothetical protein [Nostoc sp. DedVER02]MDZ8116040.1 hypothetical protein [Nostoc sp. DedVER01b]
MGLRVKGKGCIQNLFPFPFNRTVLGVWTPEQVLSTPMFEKAMSDREMEIHQQLLPNSIDYSFETSIAEC